MKRNKQSSYLPVFLLGLTAILFAACQKEAKESPKAEVQNIQAIKKIIQEKENEFAELYNSRELKKIDYYAEDAISFSQNSEPVVGREAIVSVLKSGIDSNSTGNSIQFITNQVFPSNDGEQVLEVGYYQLVDSSKTPINTGNYMVLFEKRDGNYVSVREMSVSDMPLE